MKRIFTFYILLISVLSISVSSLTASERPLRAKGHLSLNGKVVDKSTGKALSKVMVQLYMHHDSTYVSGTVTDSKGQFNIPQLIAARYYVCFTYLGMKKYTENVHLTYRQKALSIGTIKMEPDAVQLNETVVTAEASQVVLKGDTAIFSASAYTLAEGAVVEDLIKRLPGVDLDSDGKITVNGKEVNKILVDGKEFFAGNDEIALKNLTADIVSNVKSYEQESKMAKATGVKDGKEEQVLDISIKPEMKKGWFGDARIAQGNHTRYGYGGMANSFYGDDQYSVLYNTENVSTRGLGGRSGSLGRTPTGKQEDQDAGISINVSRKKMTLNGTINGAINDRTNASTTSSQSYYSTGTRFAESQSNRFSTSKSLQTSFILELKPDSLTTIVLMPNAHLSNSKNTSFGHTVNSDAPLKAFDWKDISAGSEPADVFAEDTTQLLYQSYQTSYSANDNYSYSLGGQLVRKSAKRKGRSYSIEFNVMHNDGDSKSTSDNRTYYYRATGDHYTPQVQRPVDDNSGFNYQFSLGYNEPVGKGKFLRFNYAYNRSRNDNERHVYDLTQADEAEIDSLYNKHTTTLENHNFKAFFNSQSRSLFYTFGLTVSAQNIYSDYTIGEEAYDQSQHVVNYAPYLQIRHTISRHTKWTFQYQGRSRQPSVDMLSPITDYTNPTLIKEGNPDLKPSFTHTIGTQFSHYLPKKRRALSLSLGGGTVTNNFTYRRIYNEETGVTRTRPMNINGNWYANLNYTLTTPLAKKHWTGALRGYGRYSESPSYQMIDLESLKSTTTQFFFNQNVRVNYRTKSLELGVGGNLRYNTSENDLVSTTQKETFENSVDANALYRFDCGLSFALESQLINRDGFGEQEDGTDMVLNGQVSYSMLKGKTLTFSLNAMDILQQQPTISRSVYSTGERITRYDALTSYVLLSVKYRFNTMQSNKMMRFNRRPRL